MFCLEIGCGNGYVITSLALMLKDELPQAQFFATDINLHATATTRSTLEAHGVTAEVVATDIASGLHRRLNGIVDLVVVNPPYVPTPEEEVGCSGITASWAGGENGRRVIDRILLVVDQLLSGNGWLYLVTLLENNPSEICREMRAKGYGSKILLQRSTQEETLQVIKLWREVRQGHSSSSFNCFLS